MRGDLGMKVGKTYMQLLCRDVLDKNQMTGVWVRNQNFNFLTRKLMSSWRLESRKFLKRIKYEEKRKLMVSKQEEKPLKD